MAEWFEWEQGEIQKLGIKDFEFFDYLKAGLYPHSKHLKTLIPCPEEYHEYRQGCKFIESGNIYSDPCLFFNKLTKAKASFITMKARGVESLLIWKETPLYDLCFKHNFYEAKEGIDLKVSFSNIDELGELTRQDYTELQDEMGCDPADDLSLEVWSFFIVPEPEQQCEKIKNELTSKYVFSVETAKAIKSKFESAPPIKDNVDQKAKALMMASSIPEIEQIYKAVKGKKLKNEEGGHFPKRHYKELALIEFDKRGAKSFKYIRREFLENEDLYSWRTGDHERLDFAGKLYSKILQDHGFDVKNYQDLSKYHPRRKKTRKQSFVGKETD